MTAHPTPPPRRTAPLLVTAVLALVVGVALGVLGFWIATDDGGDGSRAEQDMAAGCEILERAEGELPMDPEQVSLEEPLFFELIGAGSLFMATGLADDSYESVSALGNDLSAGVNRLDLELANGAISQLQSECADR